MNVAPCRRRDERGFVLVATLWALAALAVLAAYIDGVVASDVRDAIDAKRALQAEIDRRSTEATVLYLLATGRMNHRGLVLEEVQQFADSLGEDELRARLKEVEAAAIIKVGRHLAKVRKVLGSLGLARHARYVEHATMRSERVLALSEADGAGAPYFSMVLVHRRGSAWK